MAAGWLSSWVSEILEAKRSLHLHTELLPLRGQPLASCGTTWGWGGTAGLEDGLNTPLLSLTETPHPASVSSSGEEGVGRTAPEAHLAGRGLVPVAPSPARSFFLAVPSEVRTGGLLATFRAEDVGEVPDVGLSS